MFSRLQTVTNSQLLQLSKRSSRCLVATSHRSLSSGSPSSKSDVSTKINLWAAPRVCSTSLMYSFAERPDCVVVDEPLYAFALKQTGEPRPYRDELLSSSITDGQQVIDKILLADFSKDVVFFKHMAKHLLPGLERDFMKHMRNVILLRHPANVVSSFYSALGHVHIDDTGFKEQAQLYDELTAAGQDVPVIYQPDLLSDPAASLQALCTRLDIPYYEDMLTWEAGGRPEDGLWDYLWYKNTHESTGFARGSGADGELVKIAPPIDVAALPREAQDVIEECMPYYYRLTNTKQKHG